MKLFRVETETAKPPQATEEPPAKATVTHARASANKGAKRPKSAAHLDVFPLAVGGGLGANRPLLGVIRLCLTVA